MSRNIGLFLLLLLSAIRFDLPGLVKLPEFFLILYAWLRFSYILKVTDVTPRRQAFLFVLTGFCLLISDVLNDNDLSLRSVQRVLTYILLCIELLAVNALLRSVPSALSAIIIGWSFSYVILYILRYSDSQGYGATPWPLGLGAAATYVLSLVLSARMYPRWAYLTAFGVLAVVHLAMGARSLFVTTMFAALVIIVSKSMRFESEPEKVLLPGSVRFAITLLFLAVVVSLLAYHASEKVAELDTLGPYAEKFRAQVENPYGILLAARPDIAAGLVAVAKSPWIGFGPSHEVDRDALFLYAKINASTWYPERYDQMVLAFQEAWELPGTPAHSHIVGSWIEGGIVATLSWVYACVIALRALFALGRYNYEKGPLVAFTALEILWEVIFSPGPNRLETAIRLAVLLFALREINSRRRAGKGVPVCGSRKILSMRRGTEERTFARG